MCSDEGEIRVQVMAVISYVRLGAAFSVAAGLFIVRLGVGPLRHVAPSFERAVRRGLFRAASRCVLRIAGIHLEVEGRPPTAPYFLVANHTSFFDIFILAAELGCVFVARGDTEDWPVMGYMIKKMNTIFINRRSVRDTVRVNALVNSALEEGNGIVVFPEGGVSQENRVLPFKPALLETPASQDMPVHYAAIHYATPEGRRSAAEVAIWRDGVSFVQHFRAFAALPRVDARITFGEGPVHATDRKVLATELHGRVAGLYVPFQ